MFVLSVVEAPNIKTHSLCVQTHLALSDSDPSFAPPHTKGAYYQDSLLYLS